MVIDFDNPNITDEWKKYYLSFINTVVAETKREIENASDDELYMKIELK